MDFFQEERAIELEKLRYYASREFADYGGNFEKAFASLVRDYDRAYRDSSKQKGFLKMIQKNFS